MPNVGLAFGLVFASGISTSIGALLSFAIKITDYHVLAVALGVSAGVMLFVSVVELYMTSALLAFSQGGVEARMGFIYATICLFIGMLAMKGLDMVVHLLLHLSKPGKKRSAHGGHSALAGSGDACCAHHDSQVRAPRLRQGGEYKAHGVASVRGRPVSSLRGRLLGRPLTPALLHVPVW